ncbi:MAG: MFS transporter [Candidatus Brocadiia bacterium]
MPDNKPGELTPQQVESSLNHSIKDGMAYASQVGFGEQYVGPYAIHLGANNMHMAFLGSLSPFIGNIFQMVSAEIVDKIKQRRKVYMSGAIIQDLTWIPMMLSIFLSYPTNLYLCIFSFILYLAAANMTVPPWYSMMGDLVPENSRGRYFGRRGAFAIVAQLISATIAGIFLDASKKNDIFGQSIALNISIGFIIIFGMALLSRVVSIYYVSRMHDPAYKTTSDDYFTIIDFFKRAPESNFAKFVFFVVLVTLTSQLIGPFLGIYMLRDLKYSYIDFMIAMNTLIISSFLTSVWWGRLSDRYGNKRMIELTSLGIIMIPFFWAISGHIVYICFVQFYAGVVWSGFNLCIINFIFDTVTPAKRARCFAIFNLLNGFGLFMGGFVGGIISSIIPRQFSLFGGSFFFVSEFIIIMIISGVLRLITHILFIHKFKEVRKVESASIDRIIWNILLDFYPFR